MLDAVATLTRRFHVASALRRSALRIEPGAARELLADGALLVDVRRQDDPIDSRHGAMRIAPDMIPERREGFRREVPIVLACT